MTGVRRQPARAATLPFAGLDCQGLAERVLARLGID